FFRRFAISGEEAWGVKRYALKGIPQLTQFLAHGGINLGLLDIFPNRLVVFSLLVVEVAQLLATDRHLVPVAIAARLLLALQVALLIHWTGHTKKTKIIQNNKKSQNIILLFFFCKSARS
ncbi:hypothetical protein M5D96_006632, partial [Drosophila gunungcola]